MTYDTPITVTLTLTQWNRVVNAMTDGAERCTDDGFPCTAKATRNTRDAVRHQRDAAMSAAILATR